MTRPEHFPSEDEAKALLQEHRPVNPDLYQSESPESRAWTTSIRFDCPRCHYDLTGLTVGSYCPECGLIIGTVSAQALPSSGFATASLVFGILSFPTCVVFGVGTFVCGTLAIGFWLATRHEVKNKSRSPSSLATANAGAACGITAMVIVGAILLIATL